MAGFKDFADGNYFTAAEVDGYLMRQTAMRFTTAANMTSQLGAGVREVGMIAWADDMGAYYVWDGTNWVPWMSPEKTTSVAFTAGGTNVTVGNSVVVTKWRYVGGMVKFNWNFVIGSTANMQSGNYAWGLPIAVHTDFTNSVLGQLSYWDVSLSAPYHRAVVNISNQGNCAAIAEGGTRFSTTSPVGPAVGDIINMNLEYRPTASVLL